MRCSYMDVLRSHCCAVRLVAGTQYNLVDFSDQEEEVGGRCVYERFDVPGSRYSLHGAC